MPFSYNDSARLIVSLVSTIVLMTISAFLNLVSSGRS